MTISTTTSKVSYAGDGSTTAFSYGYVFFDLDEVKVELQDDSGNITYPTKDGAGTYDYSVSGTFDDPTSRYPNGGDVTFNTAPPSGYTVAIYREVQATQSTDYVENDSFPAESHENALDKLTLLVQQVQDDTERSLRIPKTVEANTQLPAPEANQYLGWNANADALQNVTPPSFDNVENTATVSSVANLRAATFPAATTRLWLSGYYGVGTPGGGPLYRDSSDTTTADNGGTVFVDADGVRWKRNVDGPMYVTWFGAVGDGSADDSTPLGNAIAVRVDLIAHGDYRIEATIAAVSQALIQGRGYRSRLIGVDAIGTGNPILDVNAVSDVDIRNLYVDIQAGTNTIRGVRFRGGAARCTMADCILQSDLLGAYPILVGASSELGLSRLRIDTRTVGILVKPSIAGGGEATNLSIADVKVAGKGVGGTNDATIGVSIDLDVRRATLVGGLIRDILGTSGDQGFGVAIAGGNVVGNHRTEDIVLSNYVVSNTAREAYHIEGAVRGILLSNCAAVQPQGPGVKVINDYQPQKITLMGFDIAEPGSHGILAEGTGHVEDLEIVSSTVRGAAGDGVRIHQGGSNRVRLVGVRVDGCTGNGLDVRADGADGGEISGCVVTGADGYGLRGLDSATNRKILVRSNNRFEGTLGDIDTANIANLKGDLEFRSGHLVADVAGQSTILQGERKFCITRLRAVSETGPLSGSLGDTLTVRTSGGTLIKSAPVQTASLGQWQTQEYTTLDNHIVPAGEVLYVENDGAGDAAAEYVVLVEGFFFN